MQFPLVIMERYMANYTREISHMMDRLYIKVLGQDKNGFFRKKLNTKLNLLEILLLKQVHDLGEVRMNTLLKHLEIERNLLDTTLKRLIGLNLACKKLDPQDKRGQIILLTPYGDKLFDEFLVEQQRELEFILSDVTINEEKTILKFISKIVQYHTDKYEIREEK